MSLSPVFDKMTVININRNFRCADTATNTIRVTYHNMHVKNMHVRNSMQNGAPGEQP